MKTQDLIQRLVAGLLLAAVAPALMVCAAVILLDDGPPVWFRQLRIGRHGKPFWLLKLRSMRRVRIGASITAQGDPRVTTPGKILRRYKLDELPQLWNVLRGEMSFIGPRPEVPEYVDLADPQWQTVLSVLPGITDLASLAYRDEEALLSQQQGVEAFYRNHLLPRKLDMSSYYIRSRCFASDFRLIALTIRHSLSPQRSDPSHIAEQFAYRGCI